MIYDIKIFEFHKVPFSVFLGYILIENEFNIRKMNVLIPEIRVFDMKINLLILKNRIFDTIKSNIFCDKNTNVEYNFLYQNI